MWIKPDLTLTHDIAKKMYFVNIIPLFVVFAVASQFPDVRSRHIDSALAGDTCEGNDCSYGAKRRGGECVCCMSCEQMAHRVPKPLEKCPTEMKDCGDCMYGYTSKHTFGKTIRYDICTKIKANLTTPPTPPSVKNLKTQKNLKTHDAFLPWVLPTIAFVMVAGVLGLFVYKKTQRAKLQRSKDTVIPLNEFKRNPSQNPDGGNNVIGEAGFNNSLKIPEENCESTVPLLTARSMSTTIVTDALQQACPIDSTEPNLNETFQNFSRNPSAPSFLTLTNESLTDSIPAANLDELPDSGQSSNFSSGNYSQASTVPVDRLESTNFINNSNNRAVINDNNPLKFIVHGEATIFIA
uniref:Uncharacterized protein n=1 Tax=Strigamia maritima TaxID=126957 RepID=T1JCG6_STRMM